MQPGFENPQKRQLPESIRSAAIVYNGETFTGVNHANAIRELEKKHPSWHEQGGIIDGFTTSSGRFVSREEAGKIARAATQLAHLDLEEIPDAEKKLDSYHLRL